MLNIKKVDLKFEKLYVVKPEEKKFIVIHHPAASKLEPEALHAQHLARGWAGAGYNVYVRKSGEALILRPIETTGAHCPTHNRDGIGLCFEGNFDVETMDVIQFEAGIKVLASLIKEYKIPLQNVGPHKKWTATDCPGKNFPLNDLLKRAQESLITPKPVAGVPTWQELAFEEFVEKGYLTSPEVWRSRLGEQISIGETFALLNKMAEHK
jgi:hypothetical protein